EQFVAAAVYQWLQRFPEPGADPWAVPSGWRVGRHAPVSIRLRSGERTDHVHIVGAPDAARGRIEDGESRSLRAELEGDQLTVTLDGLRATYTGAAQDSRIWLAGDGVIAVLDEVREASVREDEAHSGDAELTSPMPGAVVAVSVDDGASVQAGAVVVTVEA